MARLQILELPSGINDDRPPFLLVIDQVTPEMVEAITSAERTSAELIGARAIFSFEETVHIPANEPAQAEPSPPIVDFTDLTEAKQLIEQRDEARQWARHGYEIGQKHCGWADHGVAPAWLTEGWPRAFDGCEHLQRAASLEEAESVRKRVAKEQKAVLAEALGMDPTRDWDDILNAARGLRKARDAHAEAIERVRRLHQPVEHRGQTICWACSNYDFPGQTTDSPPVAYDQCGTLHALNAAQGQS